MWPSLTPRHGCGLTRELASSKQAIKAIMMGKAMFPILFLCLRGPGVYGDKTQRDYHNQMVRIFQAWRACNHTIKAVEKPVDDGLYCVPIWDNVMCWPNYTPAGGLAQQPCAGYIDGFNTNEKAHRRCMENGTWEIHPHVNISKSWTDFRDCTNPSKTYSIDPDIAHHIPKITLISTVGYSISLTFLLVATILMIGLKKLHCQRNTIHTNLFVSFILRAAVSLVRNGALVKGFAFSWDFHYDDNGTLVFTEGKTHWECKLLNTLHHYAIGANYTWIFVEGLYLHTLIFFAVFFQAKKYFKAYIIIGWSFPLIFVIIWVLLRIYENNTLCWNTHDKGFYWVLEAPIIASITVNFFFFLNIIRVLFTKIRNCNSRDPKRFRKLAKSTLVLIPLFGVYYIIFIIMTRLSHTDDVVHIVHMYLEMTFNSFQGIVVAFLFCFLNEEVRTEVSKIWSRRRLKRKYSSTRSSHAFSTSSFALRERFSVSQVVSPTNENGNNPAPDSNSPTLQNSLESINDIKTIPRVPSESRVTFKLNDSIHHYHSVSEEPPLPSTSNEDNRDSYPHQCDQNSGEELDPLITVKLSEDHNLNYETSSKNLTKVNGSKNNFSSQLPSSAPYRTSNGLCLVKEPTYILQQIETKTI